MPFGLQLCTFLGFPTRRPESCCRDTYVKVNRNAFGLHFCTFLDFPTRRPESCRAGMYVKCKRKAIPYDVRKIPPDVKGMESLGVTWGYRLWMLFR